MIQRKQTLFLLAAFIMTVACLCLQVGTIVGDMSSVKVFNLWIVSENGQHEFTPWYLFALLMLSSLVSLTTIFLYTKRKLQAQFCLIDMLLLILWYVMLAVLPQTTGGSIELEWPAVLPAASIIACFLARKGILADEKLVRSLDRIR